jgi:hypothetical protein
MAAVRQSLDFNRQPLRGGPVKDATAPCSGHPQRGGAVARRSHMQGSGLLRLGRKS